MAKAGLVQIRDCTAAPSLATAGTAAAGRFGLTASCLGLVGLTGADVPYAPEANPDVDIFVADDCTADGTEVCAELGRLVNALGEPKVAAAYYREGLQLREQGLPELPMPARLPAARRGAGAA